MRKTLAVVSIAAAVAFLCYTTAQSQTKVLPKHTVTVLLNNANITVVRGTWPPGFHSDMTTLKRNDPATMAYIIDGPAHVQKHYADGHVATFKYPTGSAHYDPAGQGTYRTNVGSNTFTWLVVVFKR